MKCIRGDRTVPLYASKHTNEHALELTLSASERVSELASEQRPPASWGEDQ